MPYDWGWFAFVYDKTKTGTVPANFEALAASDLKIVIQDPRSSTPGLGLLLWVKAAYGDRAGAIWEGLVRQYRHRDARLVGGLRPLPRRRGGHGPVLHDLARLSPHRRDDDSKAAAAFTEGHYLQVEVAAKLKGSDQDALADRFLAFIASDDFQSVIPETNWMYPAVTPASGLPEGFETLIRPEKSLLYPA